MTYDSEKTQEIKGLPSDLIVDGVVVDIVDGTVKDFVENTEKWKNPGSKAIQLKIEARHDDRSYFFNQVITYMMDSDVVLYTRRSKMGQYSIKYGHAPRVEDKVKCLTNADGFLRLKVD